MPMVKIVLGCGCVAIAHYRQKEPWTLLPAKERERIKQQAERDHLCKRQATAPVKADPRDAT